MQTIEPIIIQVDEIVHDNEHPFCSELGCPCHRDNELIETHLVQPQRDGLLTPVEAMRLYHGRQIVGEQA